MTLILWISVESASVLRESERIKHCAALTLRAISFLCPDVHFKIFSHFEELYLHCLGIKT